MRLEKKFGDLTPGDHFFHNDVEWVVLDNKLEDELRRKDTICNAITVDGTAKVYLEDSVIVKASRIKVHILDLRQGDQVTMDRNLDIAFNVSTVLKVWDKDGYRHVTIARPMLWASGFGTTSPSAHVSIEKYNTMARLNDYKRDEYYYVVGIDTSALWDAHLFQFNADKFRFAVYLRANGDKREMADLLISDYTSLREDVMRLVSSKHKRREDVPPFPDRHDGAEAEYHKNLLDRFTRDGDLSESELRYLHVQHALDLRFGKDDLAKANKERKLS